MRTFLSLALALIFCKAFPQEVLKSGVYLKAPGITLPMENFGYSSKFTGDYNSLGGVGLDATVGMLIYLMDRPSPVVPGIDFTIASLSFINHKVYLPTNDPYSFYDANERLSYINYQIGLGPLVTINPISKLYIDMYGKVNFAIGTLRYHNYYATDYSLQSEEVYGARFVGGINLCYSKVGLTAEYNYGRPKFKRVENNQVITHTINTSYVRLGVMFRFSTVKEQI